MEDNLVILNEMYFGKIPGLLKIEDLFAKLKQKPVNDIPLYRTIVKDPILRKIADEFSKIFGFKETVLTMARDETFNAYCIRYVSDGRGNIYDIDENKIPYKQLRQSVIIDNNGFRFDSKKLPINIVICINLGCVFKSKTTIPELLAVLLHEVGHTFSLVMMGVKMTAKADETQSDAFCTMYGYGPELTSAFSKIAIRYSDFDKKFKDIPILNVITGISQICKGYLTYDPNEDHPVIKVRLENIIRQLEVDLKETPNLTPTMRQDLEKQIETCKRIVSDTYDITDKDNMGIRMTKRYYGETEPNFSNEVEARKESDKYAHPSKLNQRIKEMKQGWYR